MNHLHQLWFTFRRCFRGSLFLWKTQNLFNGTEIEIDSGLMVKFVGVMTVAVVTKNHFTVNLRGVASVGDLDFA